VCKFVTLWCRMSILSWWWSRHDWNCFWTALLIIAYSHIINKNVSQDTEFNKFTAQLPYFCASGIVCLFLTHPFWTYIRWRLAVRNRIGIQMTSLADKSLLEAMCQVLCITFNIPSTHVSDISAQKMPTSWKYDDQSGSTQMGWKEAHVWIFI
jgi:hypothetical protein